MTTMGAKLAETYRQISVTQMPPPPTHLKRKEGRTPRSRGHGYYKFLYILPGFIFSIIPRDEFIHRTRVNIECLQYYVYYEQC
jgi:hypothetical protein